MKKFTLQGDFTVYGLDFGLEYNTNKYIAETLNKTIRGSDCYTTFLYKDKLSEEGIKTLAAVYLKTTLQVLGLTSLDEVAFGKGDFIGADKVGVYPVYVHENPCDNGNWEYQVESWISKYQGNVILDNDMFMRSSLLLTEGGTKLYRDAKSDRWGNEFEGWGRSL